MTTVIFGLLVFSVLVIFHEAGHFVVARLLKVRVERFSVGFGPVVYSRVKNGVQYAVSAFPLGGYVKMGGDDPRDRSNLKPGDLFAAPWWRRVLIALAGPGANFVLAIALSIVLAWVGIRLPDAPNEIGHVKAGSLADSLGLAAGERVAAVDGTSTGSLQAVYEAMGNTLDAKGKDAPVALTVDGASGGRTVTVPPGRLNDFLKDIDFPLPAQVGEVGLNTPAWQAGLSKGDRILAVNGTPVANWTDMAKEISSRPGEQITLRVDRGGQTFEKEITPAEEKVDGKSVGRIGIAPASPETYTVRFGFGEGIVQGTRGAVSTVVGTAAQIGMLFSSPKNLKQLSGPVAIIQASGDAAKAGWDRLLNLGMVLSVALMVFNLLPIPILDGGMVLLSVLEAVRRRPLGETGLTIYQGIGMAVLGTILLFVLINDPLRLLQRRNALDHIGDISP